MMQTVMDSQLVALFVADVHKLVMPSRGFRLFASSDWDSTSLAKTANSSYRKTGVR